MSDEIIVISANFGGAARAVPATGGGAGTRPAALAEFIKAPSGDGEFTKLPVVAGIQEMTKLVDPLENYPEEVKTELGEDSQIYYVPTVTTDWYPLNEKWKGRWQEGIQRMEQGMATCANGKACIADPRITRPNHSIASFQGLVLDLPMIEFVIPIEFVAPEDPSVIKLAEKAESLDLLKLQFQPARYKGNRNTERRLATAHRVWLSNQWSERKPQFVLINVHLTTRKEEDNDHKKQVGILSTKKVQTKNDKEQLKKIEDGELLLATKREPSNKAICLRYLQLGVIRDFIGYVYEELRLPVIVAGDFNATPSAPEMLKFANETALKPVFNHATCWCCGTNRAKQPRDYYTDSEHKNILTEWKQTFEILTAGKAPAKIEVINYCANPDCGEPLYTHKRNFDLVDNILYTDPKQTTNRKLNFKVEPTNSKGIRIDTYFSDHLPIWCKFTVTKL